MAHVRRPPGHSDREEGEEGGDQVDAGVSGLRKESQATCMDSGRQLERNQPEGGENRDERGAALGAHG